MRLTVFTEPQQGASFDDLRRVAQHAEAAGFDGFFRSDHFLAMDDLPIGDWGLPGPTDAWITLAGLARETSTIRLGTMLTCGTFRQPGPLAITVAQVDAMTGGRVDFGLGAGWFEAEHRAYGVPFPPTVERFDRLTEQLEIITGLWTTPIGQGYTFRGKHYELVDSPALPKPVQSPHPPVIVGGRGMRRTAGLAARFADEFNVPFAPLDQTDAVFAAVERACAAIGRDPADLVRSAAQVLCCGRDDAQVRRRAEFIGRDVDDLKANALCGTPAEIVERIGQFAQIGVARLHLQLLDLADLDQLDLVAEQVAPQLA
jgi:F420-dependent oxidoreductase-like protein